MKKNVKNYNDQELIRFIFQKLDNLSHVKWYISIILKVIKPVDFHHFGKEFKRKSHFDYRIFVRISFLAVWLLLFIFSPEVSLSLPTSQDMTSAKEI